MAWQWTFALCTARLSRVGQERPHPGMNKSEQALSVLQGVIERGELTPGAMVSESQLMEMTGLGRTPVREAIQRLALSYMVRIHPNKGIEIPAISVEDQLSGLEVRRAVEVLAVGLACERGAAAELDAMRKLAGQLTGDFTLRRYTETVRETHRLIIEAAHNPYLGVLMTPLQALSRRFWIMHVRDEQREIRHGGRLHADMLNAIADRKVERASAASLALNDYLVQFTLAVVAKMASRPHSPKSK
ncbi:GntR family transcriptional regulator [Bradyrhizobium sp. U87765 SZCCT0131]|nr:MULTISPECIES: GntR family transcriptional regulator [unclassified Bradyrhizobium]MBR1220585.1 GntR family transcriptional regulator [Bradyrhizobium sp. U87765 SZCCT0131]MBR1262961.1 GntR family transcriptional regulator [Bradyrhizobium sp. U87765 SZCCT0134]MBR1307157.1 GntR family transcriptional regulator [Bradyrhizobium sp. U87765 SZCCT0110]MBR1322956.1 GntR family transcriptional regulator [Bradyrhizobium sp. U87765 SZCCT0109]MBR1346111.1 GntR family transcriptional regulator [Bradyrhizo